MVNTYGQWTEEKDYTTYPPEKWCDYDRAANYIRNVLHYEPKTGMENLITMIFLHGEDDIFDDMGKYCFISLANFIPAIHAPHIYSERHLLLYYL